ncbi:hypothetical protein [Streptomyces acidiscabies]|uniref:Uncharacterized protein n=1 Tax=Streptomyces acidiscabies TaxID=42234 RepID=A0ABU4M8X2_9ACTN|nr:hypothetical protein [Streptomyces acidiscabies]MBP5938551.1 hypothetical protein [Streptomyces sp. LBUM 1476]MDX3024536.1 hypothetical protein [Streptomyces acidiscabies]
MKPKLTARRRLALSAALAVAVSVSVWTGVRLNSYGVPAGLTLACCLSYLATFLTLSVRITDTLSTTVHRCTAPGCTFRVRLTRATPGESRHWQEITADHPRHRV